MDNRPSAGDGEMEGARKPEADGLRNLLTCWRLAQLPTHGLRPNPITRRTGGVISTLSFGRSGFRQSSAACLGFIPHERAAQGRSSGPAAPARNTLPA